VYQDSSGQAFLWVLISLVVSWLIIYTAVRAAVGHALDRVKPRFVAEAHTIPEGVQFIVSNEGSGPAFDLSVRWYGRPASEALARVPMFAPNGRLQWTLAAEPVSDDTESVARLTVAWSTGLDPSSGRDSVVLAVLVPSRLVPPK
jgi:hypothetical protein